MADIQTNGSRSDEKPAEVIALDSVGPPMTKIRRLLVGFRDVGLIAFFLILFLTWSLMWSWRYLVPANRRALSAIRAAHTSATGRADAHYWILRAARGRCYIMARTTSKLGRHTDFEVWCYWHATRRVERTAVLCKYVAPSWRAAIVEFEKSGECQKWW
jgi:hypothetical protein